MHNPIRVVVILAMLYGPVAAAAPVASVARAKPASTAASDYDKLGLSLNLGVPSGGALTLFYRPLKYVKFGGSFLYNYIGYGVGGSVTVAPRFWIAPTLTVEAGYYFDSNALDKAERHMEVPESIRPLLESVGYSYVSALVGLELGAPDGLVFFVQGGLSRVWVRTHGADDAINAQLSSTETQLSALDDAKITLGIPCAKTGFTLFF
jgi:hypothetical protein